MRHDEGVRQVGHHRVVLGVHDLLVGHIEKAKPILAKADLKHFKVNKNGHLFEKLNFNLFTEVEQLECETNKGLNVDTV